MATTIKRILIANRGEIAIRIARSAQELGIETVALYSDADASTAHRFAADFAVRLAGTALAETYLNSDLIVNIAKKSACDAVHPGYGFLAENSVFARLVREAGLIFIGPSDDAIRLLGNKLTAKQILAQKGIPVVAGSLQPVTGLEQLKKEITPNDYPILIKAALGGGGRGIRIVENASDLNAAFTTCQREAKSYFGNDAILWERKIKNPRHIEVQILADEHGNIVHLYERDCSIQRRYQKLLEEAPSPYLSESQRSQLGETAVQVAKAVNYTNAGTVEFICESPDKCYFMEVNTRIQVEHPVTEMITGVDLIKEQIAVASGQKLSFNQEEIKLHGHAIEVRINCEDPDFNFAPCPDVITDLTLPSGAFTRVDSHVYRGYRVPKEFDSLLAKLICWGQNRAEAIARLQRALHELHIEGVKTTASFHKFLLAQPNFKQGKFDTGFIADMPKCKFTGSEHDTVLAVLLAQARTNHVVVDDRKNWQRSALINATENTKK